MIRIEIVCAWPQHSIVEQLNLPQGATIAAALAAIETLKSGAAFAGVDWANAPVGIFGKLMPKEHLLHDGDRIEIYRPLAEEPKLARRERASRKASKRGRS